MAAGGAASLISGAAAVPWVLGFTTAGVAGGSIAATAQAGIGSVAAGSWFATLQAIGATTILGTVAPLALAVAVAGGTVFAFNKKKEAEERRDNDRE